MVVTQAISGQAANNARTDRQYQDKGIVVTIPMAPIQDIAGHWWPIGCYSGPLMVD